MSYQVRTITASEVDPPSRFDVRIRIWLGGSVFEFCAAPRAALTFYLEWTQKRSEAIEILGATAQAERDLPRLPCEQLFQEPGI